MPLRKYDKAFGGKRGAAAKAKRAMADQYGPEEGERIFYATKNKRTKRPARSGAVRYRAS